MELISIHAPQWGATTGLGVQLVGFRVDFNPRTPVGCDWPSVKTMAEETEFQSTHPSGVRPRQPVDRRPAMVDFNPRTPVGCDLPLALANSNVPISIHAPQWGATGTVRDHVHDGVISIHAPQWGATERRLFFLWRERGFQSTHPSGVRRKGDQKLVAKYAFQSTHPSGVRQAPRADEAAVAPISIHAPQWGATTSNCR